MTIRDCLVFMALGAILPCYGLAITGTPAPFFTLAIVMLLLIATQPRHEPHPVTDGMEEEE